MKTLTEIKDDYAKHLAEVHNRRHVFDTWDEMMSTDFEYGNGVSKIYSECGLWYNVCILAQKQALNNASESIKLGDTINNISKSILNENNIVK